MEFHNTGVSTKTGLHMNHAQMRKHMRSCTSAKAHASHMAFVRSKREKDAAWAAKQQQWAAEAKAAAQEAAQAVALVADAVSNLKPRTVDIKALMSNEAKRRSGTFRKRDTNGGTLQPAAVSRTVDEVNAKLKALTAPALDYTLNAVNVTHITALYDGNVAAPCKVTLRKPYTGALDGTKVAAYTKLNGKTVSGRAYWCTRLDSWAFTPNAAK